MKRADFTQKASDGATIHAHRWLPQRKPIALLLVAHGKSEQGRRFERLGTAFADSGLGTCVPDGSLDSFPSKLPAYIAAGGEDPIGAARGAAPKLAERLKARGVREVETRLYDGARHGLIHEMNADEAIGDLSFWLESVLARQPDRTRRSAKAVGAEP